MQQEAIDVGTFTSMKTEIFSMDEHDPSEHLIDE
jgi:hypothetical protein